MASLDDVLVSRKPWRQRSPKFRRGLLIHAVYYVSALRWALAINKKDIADRATAQSSRLVRREQLPPGKTGASLNDDKQQLQGEHAAATLEDTKFTFAGAQHSRSELDDDDVSPRHNSWTQTDHRKRKRRRATSKPNHEQNLVSIEDNAGNETREGGELLEANNRPSNDTDANRISLSAKLASEDSDTGEVSARLAAEDSRNSTSNDTNANVSTADATATSSAGTVEEEDASVVDGAKNFISDPNNRMHVGLIGGSIFIIVFVCCFAPAIDIPTHDADLKEDGDNLQRDMNTQDVRMKRKVAKQRQKRENELQKEAISAALE
ncbi:unnamed protein product [Amoebophrya sp. A25]|nr:unnamed protein product [Amoebophrya sp. A25]|eukprot:GSA25T00002147001.1